MQTASHDCAVPFDPARPVTIVGAGVMGTKVAWACARAGLETRFFDIEPGKAVRSRDRALGWSEGAEQKAVRQNLIAVDDSVVALDGSQLVFENVPEKLDLKRSVLADLSAGVPASAYVGSNASSLLCSPLAEACARPARFFCLNFTDPRSQRLVELMGCKLTDVGTFGFARRWSRHIGMVPVQVRKEQLGYSFNRLWRVIKKEVLRQIAEGYASPEDIDRAWMLTFGTRYGPCGLMDEIGLHSVRNVERVYYAHSGDEADRPPEFLEKMIAQNLLGEITGQGFYSYPDPEFGRSGFLEGESDE